MGILSKIFSKGASDLVDSVGKVIDNVVTTKEEKEVLKNKFTELLQDHEAKMTDALTERHRIDMVSDNKLSKLIRPMTLIYMTTFLTGIVIADSCCDGFVVEDAWIKLLTTLLVVVFSFYFGGRELQKWLINRKI